MVFNQSKYLQMKRSLTVLFSALLISVIAYPQDTDKGRITGNFQSETWIYQTDSITGAIKPNEIMGTNSYGNIKYNRGNFEVGVRYEARLNTLQGYPNTNGMSDGSGISNRYAKYNVDGLEVTLGNFYDQFGSGLTFRAYEEKTIGWDNAMDGIHLKYNISNAIILKGMVGKQMNYFQTGSSIIRGVDGEINLNNLITPMNESNFIITTGGSFVSNFQNEVENTYKLNKNLANMAGRLNMAYGNFNLSGEYAYKMMDFMPDYVNNSGVNYYHNGEALLVNLSYSTKGLGVLLSAKRIDNFMFRSERNATGNDLILNYIPDISKNHTYSLTAFYPYVTQPLGEFTYSGEVTYKFKRGSLLGGKYGTLMAVNYFRADGIEKNEIALEDVAGYETNFFGTDMKYYHDINVLLSKKISKKLKGQVQYQNIFYNDYVLQGSPSASHDTITANTFVADFTYKLARKHTLRFEVQGMFTNMKEVVVKDEAGNIVLDNNNVAITEQRKADYGDWLMATIEYNYNPHWYFALMDMYNYGNSDEKKQVHYPKVSIGYKKNANRFELSYGRQKAGINCTGGICVYKPAATGLTLSITSTF